MGYEKRAASLAERLRIDAGAAVYLEKEGKGDFEIFHGDRLIYSKRQTGRMPSAGQILARLNEP